MIEKIRSGILGLAVADAVGVPVEFESREDLKKSPVTDMRGYGTHNQPQGTWSDDTSMTLCLLDSLSLGLDFTDIMDKFYLWMTKGAYSPYGEVFDIGNATREAILRYGSGIKPIECGGKSKNDNGNGSLMRILPISFYIVENYETAYETAVIADIIHKLSALTHAHKRSQIACVIYVEIALNLFKENNLNDAIKSGINQACAYYENHAEYKQELEHYSRLQSDTFQKLSENDIRSSGYVVDTLEAALWCLMTTNGYKECVLKAVNLGEDTDTVAAVAGGLAGIAYGLETIPQEWLAVLEKRNYIEKLCEQFDASLSKN